MEKWEYKVEWLDPYSIVEKLNNEGSNGWELVFLTEDEDEYYCIFKRKIK